MNFSIKCETFVRLASVCSFFPSTTRQDIKEKINTVRIENRNGQSFGVVTNEKTAVVEFLHNTDQPDGYIHLILDPKLIEQCEIEKQYNSDLMITTVQEMALGSATTTMGYSHKSNPCYWFEDSPLNEWRTWAPETQPKKSINAMYWDAGLVETLVKSSPSGCVCFPEFIDARQPLIIRDVKSPHWVGLFRPSVLEPFKPAELPEWWVK